VSQAQQDHPAPVCGKCVHFRNDPAILEAAYPGLTAMGSGFSSVRAQDGLCSRHDLYLSFWDSCPGFSPVAGRLHPSASRKTPPRL
jgi:hypothetical protein